MFILAAFILLFSPLIAAVQWTTVEWRSSNFTRISGDMVVPALPPSGGTPCTGFYQFLAFPLANAALADVWPGLQSTNGVLQAVCDGRTGTWWIGDGFYGTPSLSWGAGFSVAPGNLVHFTFVQGANNAWTATLSSGSKSVSSTFAIGGPVLDRLIFAVELYDIKFSFGPLVFKNLNIVSTDKAKGWCHHTWYQGWGHPAYTISTGNEPYTVTSAVDDDYTCTVAELYMPSNTT